MVSVRRRALSSFGSSRVVGVVRELTRPSRRSGAARRRGLVRRRRAASPSVRASRISCSCVCWRAGMPLVPLVRSAQGRGVPRGGKASCMQGRHVLARSPRAALFALFAITARGSLSTAAHCFLTRLRTSKSPLLPIW